MGNYFEVLSNRYRLVKARLKSLEEHGSAATIHDTREHLITCREYYVMLNQEILIPVGVHTPAFYAEGLEKCLDKAEAFILEVAKRY